ncbi:hypothetical protein KP77_10680 [Jeotgalibacillus alimentarius]|uniref:Uncharacterized protein n=1 Tax=Jeotgalibacillus alimentarius TaxID=135826 RepID=A0A0C2W4P3_9BACL|nr:hypothetical protein [Jeotgalibacillus alimentarius]KIL51556.1 hypothetical protein KP77_10680 [Jeotgalibacillus alimentarius]
MKTTFQALLITLTVVTIVFTLAFPLPINGSIIIYYFYFAAGLLLTALPLSILARLMNLCTSTRLALYVAGGFAAVTAVLGSDFMIPVFSAVICFWVIESVIIRFSYKEQAINRISKIFILSNGAVISFVFFFTL